MSNRQEPSSGAPVVTPSIGTWAGFLLMCLGMFMAILDIQVVATSLPAIQQALAISPDAMSWVQTAYLIAEVVAIPLTGLFTRVLTLRWLFVQPWRSLPLHRSAAPTAAALPCCLFSAWCRDLPAAC